MKTKKFAVISIFVVFAVVVICSAIATFTLKSVNAVFSVSVENSARVQTVQETLDKYTGKNLLFCKTDDIKAEIEQDPYIEVVSIVKRYPDQLEVKVKDRKELYVVNNGDAYYVLSENGIVLRKSDEQVGGREYIELDLGDIKTNRLTVGSYISTEDDEMLAIALDVAQTARLTDCIKKIKLDKGVEKEDIIFSTYTAVDIVIKKAKDEGVKKTEYALKAYDEETHDYRKSNNQIIAYKLDSGEIRVVWRDQGE